jgi:hypothetical protein
MKLISSEPFEKGPVIRVEQRAVGIEGALLDDDRDLTVLLASGAIRVSGQVSLGKSLAGHRGGARQRA